MLTHLLPKVWQQILSFVFVRSNQYTEQFIQTCDETYDRNDTFDMARLMSCLREEILQRNFAEMLEHIEHPIWLIWGSHDRLVPARPLRKASKRMHHLHTEEIPRCGHMPQIEAPRRLIRFIESSLESNLALI